jgi:DMSO/TMAO reductase YedYZ molybdopterin-dependent catalytic subunit
VPARGKGALPPGQHLLDAYPRFGIPRPAPKVSKDHRIAIGGAVDAVFDVPLGRLASLPRHEVIADFHCVATWSYTGLRWEGVRFSDFYRAVIEPALRPGAIVRHVLFEGIDGFNSVVAIEDALAADVLLADRLDGRPLDADHGAPLRLVSPHQYGYMSTKHLCRIEPHSSRPKESYGRGVVAGPLFQRHPRARVWREERNAWLPNWGLRTLYWAVVPIFIRLNRAVRGKPTAR